ncbi:transcriptional regulator GntR family [Clostridium sp. CAG:354]|jgi:GntR family transcriptional regulator|nr:transcriptional regulator GntR family [Clostridium sp. CAG:354]
MRIKSSYKDYKKILTTVIYCYILNITVRKEEKMNIIISNSSSDPLYEQIKKAIKQAIYTNELKEEEILPSVRALANDLKISFLTVKKAYDELEAEGFIKTVQGKGSYVLPKNLELLREEKLKEIEKNISTVVKLSKIYGITEEEVINLIKIMFEEDL